MAVRIWAVDGVCIIRRGCSVMVCARVLAGGLAGVWKAIEPVAIQWPRPDVPTVRQIQVGRLPPRL